MPAAVVCMEKAAVLRDAGIGRDALQILLGQHALGERREADNTHTVLAGEVLEPVLLDGAVQNRVAILVDDERQVDLTCQLPRLGCVRAVVI